MAISRSYFDFDDYKDPVKTFLNEADNYYLLSNFTTQIEYSVQENTALTSDEIVIAGPFKESKFYDIASANVKTINQAATGGAVLSISISSSSESVQFERTAKTLFDLFGYLGGLFDFMFFVGFWFINGFQSKIFQNLISSKMYQVKSNKDYKEPNENSSRSIIEEVKCTSPQMITTQDSRFSFKKRSNRVLPNINIWREQIMQTSED